METKHTEATRVQIPALVHLTRLGFNYIKRITETQAGTFYDADTNILLDVFKSQFEKLNPTRKAEFEQTLHDIRQELDNDDLGKTFYKRLLSISPTRLIDFDNVDNNTFHCTGEFTCKNGQEEFRPDITLFVNGLPLVYVEVKKPNNKEGIVAERDREYKKRFPNKKFRRFNNITQLMLFSNNMEYDTMGGIVPVQGVFYCTIGKKSAPFNCFREENPLHADVPPFIENFPYWDIDDAVEKQILADFNAQVIHHAPEYITNKEINTPTNRVLTSMCSPERLLYILRYGIAYVDKTREKDGAIEEIHQKHIMRYQQLFASYAVTEHFAAGEKSGIIWHTQGSGKTALSFYLTRILTDFYAKQNTVAKFYFIVDRLDLAEQAKQEFKARGISVVTANSKKELMDSFAVNQSMQGNAGQTEITVVNIQKFEPSEKINFPQYATKLQRVFIIDEAHRGYKPDGCFLSNLFNADKEAVKIALTGTPLIGDERKSCAVFGPYFHTYYYDKSAQDGYTLKIIREEIETSWKETLSAAYDKAKESLSTLVTKKDVPKSVIVEHETFVEPLCKYIQNDLCRFRQVQGDPTFGGMVICETSEQARRIYAYFEKQWEAAHPKAIKVKLPNGEWVLGEPEPDYGPVKGKPLKAALILHDEGTKEDREKLIADFKDNFKVDLLIVFNMLITGFDAPRLKRLYFNRNIKEHNLLQAITRVNRPYQGTNDTPTHYGYVIDFADIKEDFKQTNEAYLRELSRFNNPDEQDEANLTDTFSQVLEDSEKIIERMQEIRNVLFNYPTNNLEQFASEISTLEDKQELLALKNALVAAKEMGNLVRTFGDEDLQERFKQVDMPTIPKMLSEVSHHIDFINIKERFYSTDETKQAIDDALANIEFDFNKIGSEELKIISGGEELQDKYRNAIHGFTNNPDPEDPEYIALQEMFMQRFKEKGFKVNTIAEFNEATKDMDDILKRLAELKRRNDNLLQKYNGDAKFARVHKRICEENAKRSEHQPKEKAIISEQDFTILNVLLQLKKEIDEKVYDRNDILRKDAYFEQTVMQLLATSLQNLKINAEDEDYDFVQSRVAKQYLDQYNQTYAIQ